MNLGVLNIYIWGNTVVSEPGCVEAHIERNSKDLTKEEIEKIRETIITTQREIKTVHNDTKLFLYKINLENARKWSWLPFETELLHLLVKSVSTKNDEAKVNFNEQHLEDYIENTKNVIRKIERKEIDLRKDFYVKNGRYLLYNDDYLRARINPYILIEVGDSFVRLWISKLFEQFLILATKRMKEELDKKTRKMKNEKIKENKIKLEVPYVIDENHRLEYYWWIDALSKKDEWEYYYHFGTIPRIAFVLGKDSNGEKTIIELGKLDTPTDLLEVLVRAAEVSREFERTFEDKEPVLPSEIYEKVIEIKKTFNTE